MANAMLTGAVRLTIPESIRSELHRLDTTNEMAACKGRRRWVKLMLATATMITNGRLHGNRAETAPTVRR